MMKESFTFLSSLLLSDLPPKKTTFSIETTTFLVISCVSKGQDFPIGFKFLMATIHLCRSKQQPQFEKHHWQKTAHGHSHWTCPGPAGRPVAGFSIIHGCHRFCFGWVVCTLHSNETTMLPIDLSSGFELATIGPFLSPTKIY